MKELILIVFIFFSMGCAASIVPLEGGGCKAIGFGSVDGEIEGKCKVKKGIITFPPIRLNP